MTDEFGTDIHTSYIDGNDSISSSNDSKEHMIYKTKTYTRITITTKEGKQTIDLPQDSTLEIIEDDFEVEHTPTKGE